MPFDFFSKINPNKRVLNLVIFLFYLFFTQAVLIADVRIENNNSSIDLSSGIIIMLSKADRLEIQKSLKNLDIKTKTDSLTLIDASEIEQSHFIDELRGINFRMNFLSSANIECQGFESNFSSTLIEVEQDLLIGSYKSAELKISNLWKYFPCQTELAKKEDIARFLFLSGALKVYQGDDDNGMMGEAISVFPEIESSLKGNYKIQQTFENANKNKTARVFFDTEINQSILSTLNLRVDGSLVGKSSKIKISSGRHFLQLTTKDDLVIASAITTLVPVKDQTPILPPAKWQLKEKDSFYNDLVLAVNNNNKSSDLEKTISYFLKKHRIPWVYLGYKHNKNLNSIVFKIEKEYLSQNVNMDAKNDLEGKVLPSRDAVKDQIIMDNKDVAITNNNTITKNLTKEEEKPNQANIKEPEKTVKKDSTNNVKNIKKKKGIIRTAALAGLTLASGVVWGITYNKIYDNYANRTESESKKLVAITTASSLLTITSFIGTSISASITWQKPSFLYRTNSKKIGLVDYNETTFEQSKKNRMVSIGLNFNW